jgi:hypothetical protein
MPLSIALHAASRGLPGGATHAATAARKAALHVPALFTTSFGRRQVVLNMMKYLGGLDLKSVLVYFVK